jgi:hypothetical protein
MASAIELYLLAGYYASLQQVQVASGPTTINSTTPAQISGLSWTVLPGTYRVSGRITGVAAASGTTQPGTIRFNGTATASSVLIGVNAVEQGAGQSVNYGDITALNADPGVISGAWALSSRWTIDFSGSVTFSAAGTFYPEGRVTTSGSDADWVSQAGSWMQVVPA